MLSLLLLIKLVHWKHLRALCQQWEVFGLISKYDESVSTGCISLAIQFFQNMHPVFITVHDTHRIIFTRSLKVFMKMLFY